MSSVTEANQAFNSGLPRGNCFVTDDPAVANFDHALGSVRHLAAVGDDDQSHTLLAMQPVEEVQDFGAGVRVEIAGRFVGQQQGRPVGKRRAIAMRCRSPTESWLGRWSAR